MNPCPCGHAGDPSGRSTCSAADVLRYRGRLSGPLADRVDLHVAVGAVPVRELADGGSHEDSATVRRRVERARATQRVRYTSVERPISNGRAPGRWLETQTPVHADARELLACAADRMGLSARGYHRVLRVARTIADLDGEAAVRAADVAEALRYRPAGQPLPAAAS
jgi:magnesium chelatase family protein